MKNKFLLNTILFFFFSFIVLGCNNNSKTAKFKNRNESVPPKVVATKDGIYTGELSVHNGNNHGLIPISVKVAGDHYVLGMYNDLLPNSFQELSGRIDESNNMYILNGSVTPPIGHINVESGTIKIKISPPPNLPLTEVELQKK